MSQNLIVANWKMNHTVKESKDFVNNFKTLSISDTNQIVICPPFTSIDYLIHAFLNTNIYIGSQNCYIHSKGAFTGEISSNMLSEMGCRYVIVGHSERRSLFFEDETIIGKKMNAIFQSNMTPILCVGEDINCRSNGLHYEHISDQLNDTFNLLESKFLSKKIIVAYEPIWSIGTGKIPSIQDIQLMHLHIKNHLMKLGAHKSNISVLYGGSVNENNASDIISPIDVDGFLVGGASLDPSRFLKLINAVS